MSKNFDTIEDLERLTRKTRYSVSALAASWGLSERQFERHFRADFGITPSAWRDSVRMKRAADLVCTGMEIKTVASELFFDDPSHFTRAFKRVKGLTPLAFFRQHLRDSRQNVG